MQSLEFAPKLDWSKAQEYRRKEAHTLTVARNTGLRDEAREYSDLLRQDPIYQAAQTLTFQHRWEHLAKKVPEFSLETWEKTGRVLSGINNGVKAALFADIALTTRPSTYMSTEDITAHFKELFAGTQLLEAFGRNTKGHVIKICQESLCDVGLLTAKYSVAGELIGFGVTEEGLNSGLPHALRLLAWENAINQSARPILGEIHTKGETRAPFNSARILEYLFHHPYNVREVDLIDAIGVAYTTANSTLGRFNTLGLVDYKVVNPRTAGSPLEFAWDTNTTNIKFRQTQYFINAHKFQDAVITVIQQKGLVNQRRFSIADIAQQLPEKIRRNWKEKSLRHEISKILTGLTTDGFLQRVNDFKGGEKQSDIALFQKGRSFFFHIILPTLLESPPQPLTNPSKLAQASAKLYYPHSSSNKQREHQNNTQRLVQAIGEGIQTARELAEILKLSVDAVRKILSPHIKGSFEVIVEVGSQPVIIIRTKKKGVWYHSLKNPHSE